MVALSDRIGEIARLIPPAHSVVFLDYPVYLNVGDLLIEQGTEVFLKAFGYQVTKVRSAYDFSSEDAAAIDPQATIVLQGGGNFGDLYHLHQQFRERVIKQCRKNRIVLLPQTVYFESPQRLSECIAAFSAHPDLHVCLRDQTSYAFFRRHFRNPAYLYPDMAHFLWADYERYRKVEPTRSTLCFARVDQEERPIAYVDAKGGRPIDWRDLFTVSDRVTFRLLHRLHLNHLQLLPQNEIHPLWRMFRNHLIRKSARMLVQHDRVVTNRLHMALLGLLTGREVIMADNSYGKLSAYYACWLKDIPSISLLDSPVPGMPRRSSVPAAE